MNVEDTHEVTIQREWEDSRQFNQKKIAVLPGGEMLELDPEATHHYENSPIEEEKQESSAEKNFEEEDINNKTDYKELLQISQEVKKKDQSRKLVLWEADQMRGKWEISQSTTQKQKGWQRGQKGDWDLKNQPRPEDFATKPMHEQHHMNLSSKVTYLTDYPEQVKRKNNIRQVDRQDPLHELPKKDRHLTNIFLQSLVQQHQND